jgi:hypothetical protein
MTMHKRGILRLESKKKNKLVGINCHLLGMPD